MRWLAWWLEFAAALLLAASVVVAVASLVEAVRGAAASWVAALVAVGFSLLMAGLGLEALAQLARALADKG